MLEPSIPSSIQSLSRVQLCETPETAAHQAPPSLGFPRQEHWSGLPFPSPMQACILRCFSHVQLCAIPWTAAHQAPLSIGFSRQEYWNGLPFPSSGDLPNPGVKLRPPTLWADSLPSEPPGNPTVYLEDSPIDSSLLA